MHLLAVFFLAAWTHLPNAHAVSQNDVTKMLSILLLQSDQTQSITLPSHAENPHDAIHSYFEKRIECLDERTKSKIQKTWDRSYVGDGKWGGGFFMSPTRVEIEVPGREPWLSGLVTAHELEHAIQYENVTTLLGTQAWDPMERDIFINLYVEAGAMVAEHRFLQMIPDSVVQHLVEGDFLLNLFKPFYLNDSIRLLNPNIVGIKRRLSHSKLNSAQYVEEEWKSGRYAFKGPEKINFEFLKNHVAELQNKKCNFFSVRTE